MARKISVLGDSISSFEGVVPQNNRWYYDEADTNGTGVTAPEETWWSQVIAHEGGALLSNGSFSGSMVDGASFPAGRSRRRAKQVLARDGEKPDEVLVFIGINDYGWGSPEAQFVGGSEAASPHTNPEAAASADPAGPAPGDAVERFGSAYASMLANIRDVAPEAEVWCVTLPPARVAGDDSQQFCFALRGIPLDEYNEAIKKAAEMEGASVADVRALGLDYESTDGTHPTLEGMSQLATLVEAAMAKSRGNEDEADALLAGYPERLRSREGRTEPAYSGCPGSTMTSSRWSCVIPG